MFVDRVTNTDENVGHVDAKGPCISATIEVKLGAGQLDIYATGTVAQLPSATVKAMAQSVTMHIG